MKTIKTPPIPKLKDYNKIPIVPGKLVAFNYSGDVRLGKVERFKITKPNKNWQHLGYKGDISIVVRHLTPLRNHTSAHAKTESIIKRPESLCVVEPDDLLIHLL